MPPAAAPPLDLPHALQQALALAEQAIGLTDPNPRVGCVLLSPAGQLLGSGHTQAAGQAHAEVMALRDAAARGHDLRGATAVVTLEPCSHHGRTPPCCDALVAAGIARVVVAVQDPNPQVAGQGLARLRAAGLQVELAAPAVADAARELNIGFFSRMQRGRPFVRLKSAISLDGRTALPDGRSQWITGEAARADGHAWRRRAGAVLTGIGTVLADDPRMDVRLVPTSKQPLRLVLDPRGRLPAAARILQPPGEARVIGPGRADLPALLAELGAQGVNELHVEAGPVLSGAFLAAGLVDELLVYQAPLLVGEGRPLAALPPLAALGDAPRWRLVEATAVGADLRLRLRPT
ncbi:MAG: bifunctional diaminohydroxyphosphoribosylaminopyrimidine deaminase/5-amino-6-(5-phosphoribosylamino)uracil reductase RibD [Roseateles sp.]|uniref:bifunctional diaminohydroxyphosphoribosylaminopyrimidine deaminase/5-amino-6-(5-phosphoribosylamino)uracil reductase RibD n=1 Tax=Roseateles sp. TaxID=1971397 RepID=UPI0039E86D88